MNMQKSTEPILSVAKLNAFLLESAEPYLLESGELPANKVTVKFTGTFSAEPVVWNACIRTIEEYSRHHETAEDPMQFIEIKIEEGVHFIQVGLNIALIDKPAIERTILMVRHYKRLHLGRHEYGARSKTD